MFDIRLPALQSGVIFYLIKSCSLLIVRKQTDRTCSVVRAVCARIIDICRQTRTDHINYMMVIICAMVIICFLTRIQKHANLLSNLSQWLFFILMIFA